MGSRQSTVRLGTQGDEFSHQVFGGDDLDREETDDIHLGHCENRRRIVLVAFLSSFARCTSSAAATTDDFDAPTPAWTEPVVARKPQVTIEAPISSPSPPPPEAYVRPRPHHVPQNATITVQPFAVQQEVYQGPNLPRVKPPQLTRHRHSTNPTFALGILQDIATIVEQWQADLEEIHLQIQDVYMDGPIVDGWLEAETTLDGQVQGYRLCGLDEQGRMWARPCPPDQLPSVSVAIARYQHLRQLSTQKQQVEKRLKQLGEKLALLHSRL